MIAYVSKSDGVVTTVHKGHPWSPADYVVVIEIGKDNRACLSARQLHALKTTVDQCAMWIAYREQLERMNACPGCGDSQVL